MANRRKVRNGLVLYDAECRLCRGSIRFIVARDPKRVFTFASLDSKIGRALLTSANLTEDARGSIVLFQETDGVRRIWRRSDAVLRIARRLRFPWPLFSVFLILPRFLRDPLYRLVARFRYAWFGKVETTGLPVPEEPERFVDRDEPIPDARPGVCKI